MSDDTTVEARRAVAALLEPSVVGAAHGVDVTNVHQLDRLAVLSRAVSLRRIADALDRAHPSAATAAKNEMLGR